MGPVLGVTGVNTVGYTYDSGWINQGGKFKTGIAVAYADGIQHQFGVALNGFLYHRTATTPWHRLVPDTFKCKDVAAVSDGQGSIHVGCTGLNNALYTFSFDATLETPFVSGGWTKADGMTITNEIEASTADGEVYFETKGDENPVDGETFNQWYWTGSSWEQDYIMCATTTAWTTYGPRGGTHVCGVTNPDGSRAIHVDIRGFNSFDIPGATNYAPAIAVIDDATLRVFVQGLNGKLYGQDIVEGTPTGSWTNHGGALLYGVSAASTFDGTVLPPINVIPQSADSARPGATRG